MTDLDYEKLGFKSGLEIHHQIDTKTKLFCRCPCLLRNDEHNSQIVRHMRPTMSELGEYDGTALMEFKTRKKVIYRIYFSSVCTYEIDDTPPFPIDTDAVDKCLLLSMLFGCGLVDEIHVARKQYLDGSIPTGFQRTAIMGVNGSIPYKGRTIEITQCNLEEDSCREISDVGHTITFNTDRLGIPLIEVITGADMKTPTEIMEVAEILGRVLRTSGAVRRGLGAARQDVNVSIEGGRRVEIKGVSRIEFIKPLTENEARRQKALLEIKDLLIERGLTHELVKESEEVNVSEIFKDTSCEFLREALKEDHRIMAVRLPKFAGMMNYETQVGIPFRREFAGRIRVIACIDSEMNILHSEELPGYGVSDEEAIALKKALDLSDDDIAVMVWGNEEDTATGIKEIKLRAIDAIEGVPNETRQPLKDGTTDFERILPGPERMYPDTDTPPQAVTAERLDRIRKGVPVIPLWDREDKYTTEYKLPGYMARSLAISRYANLFDVATSELSLSPMTMAVAIDQSIKHLKRSGFITKDLPDETVRAVFDNVEKGEMAKEAIIAVLAVIGSGELSVDEAKEQLKIRHVDIAEVKEKARALVAEKAAIITNKGDRAASALMGILMNDYRGSVDGKAVWDALEEAFKQ